MSWSRDFLFGIAEHLDSRGIVDWRPPPALYTAPYSGVPAVLEQLPDDLDPVVALSIYANPPGDGTADVQVGFQLLWRGDTDPATAWDYSDAAFDVLHEAAGLVLGGPGRRVYTTRIWRESTALLGQDPSLRWMRSDNYYAIASRPTIHRPD